MNVKNTQKKIIKVTAVLSLIMFLVIAVRTFIQGDVDAAKLMRLIGSLMVIVPGAFIAAIALYIKDEKDKRNNAE